LPTPVAPPLSPVTSQAPAPAPAPAPAQAPATLPPPLHEDQSELVQQGPVSTADVLAQVHGEEVHEALKGLQESMADVLNLFGDTDDELADA